MRNLLLSTLLLTACEGSNGTTPCMGIITTTFSGGTWEDGDYSFGLVLNGGGTGCDFALPDGACNEASPVIDADALTIVHYAGTSQNPETVRVTLERDGTPLYDGEITPTWVEVEGSGGASGTCWSTDIDVDLGA